MAIERVRAYLEQYGAADRVLEFGVSSATVELAAKALGCEPGRIAKSLSFGVGEGYIVIVTAGDCKIDNAKYKAKFHAKARMLTPPEVEEHIGHAVGGVCPFGVNDGVAVYLDESLRRFGTVFPACGSSNSAIELTIEELERYSRCAEWVDVCKRIGQERLKRPCRLPFAAERRCSDVAVQRPRHCCGAYGGVYPTIVANSSGCPST